MRQKRFYRLRHGNYGFSLLELMLSLTLLSLVVVIVISSVWGGCRVQAKGEQLAAQQQQLRIGMRVVTRQLSSATYVPAAYKNALPAAFQGTGDMAAFVSGMPLNTNRTRGLVFASYRIVKSAGGTKNLLFYETALHKINQAIQWQLPGLEDYHPLILEASDIEFEYLSDRYRDEAPGWHAEWKPTRNNELPLAVNIRIQPSEDVSPVCQIARLYQALEF